MWSFLCVRIHTGVGHTNNKSAHTCRRDNYNLCVWLGVKSRLSIYNIFHSEKLLQFFSSAPDGVRTSSLWISSLTSYPVTPSSLEFCGNHAFRGNIAYHNLVAHTYMYTRTLHLLRVLIQTWDMDQWFVHRNSNPVRSSVVGAGWGKKFFVSPGQFLCLCLTSAPPIFVCTARSQMCAHVKDLIHLS